MANTLSNMNLGSPIMKDMFFMILADLRLEVMRNWRSCRDLFENGLGKGFWKIDYMPYGSPSQVFTIETADNHDQKVLCSNGQPPPRAGSEIFQRCLSRQEWYVVVNIHNSV